MVAVKGEFRLAPARALAIIGALVRHHGRRYNLGISSRFGNVKQQNSMPGLPALMGVLPRCRQLHQP